MMDFSPEVQKALEKGRVGAFVHIDLLFFQIRVHDGVRTVKWNDCSWKGMGGALKSPFTQRAIGTGNPSSKPLFEADVPLPMNRKLGEALVHGYYFNRKLRINVCALTEGGDVLGRVRFHEGTITNCSTTDSVTVTLHVEDTTLKGSTDPTRDPEQDKEVIYNAGVRKRLKQNLFGILVSEAKGDLVGAVSSFLPFAFLGNLLSSSAGRLYRLFIQRWGARKKFYTVDAGDPSLRVSYLRGVFKVRLRRRWIRADTKKDAVTQFHDYVRKIVWRIPRGFIRVPLMVDGKFAHFINLDHYRMEDDPQKWADTDPVRNWGKDGESERNYQAAFN